MATSGYTCITCRVAFTNGDLQRAHYKTDWHKYNLKRKVAELPPVTAENFQERVLAQRAATAELDAKQSEFCDVCKKLFTTRNSYDSHIRSRKHKERVIMMERRKSSERNGELVLQEEGNTDSVRNKKNAEEMNQAVVDGKRKPPEVADSSKAEREEEEEESTESDYDPEPLEITECLFCPKTSEDLESNLNHMSLVHGFFLPDLDYLVDVKGLISYLCEKVGVGYICLYCNEKGKTFYSVESVQQHMVDKCHCKLFFEGDAAVEYAEYYDYSKSYPDNEKVGEEEREGEGDLSNVPGLPNSSLEVTDDLALVLPSGVKVGHRSLKQFYKQRPPSLEHRKSTLVTRLMAQYRALGWKGYVGEGAAKRERDEAWIVRMKQARSTKLSVKANKLQKHFRPQVVF